MLRAEQLLLPRGHSKRAGVDLVLLPTANTISEVLSTNRKLERLLIS
jgi:hypothetical protein